MADEEMPTVRAHRQTADVMSGEFSHRLDPLFRVDDREAAAERIGHDQLGGAREEELSARWEGKRKRSPDLRAAQVHLRHTPRPKAGHEATGPVGGDLETDRAGAD